MKCWYCEHDGNPEIAYNVCQTHYAEGKKITQELRESWRRNFFTHRFHKAQAKRFQESATTKPDIFSAEREGII